MYKATSAITEELRVVQGTKIIFGGVRIRGELFFLRFHFLNDALSYDAGV